MTTQFKTIREQAMKLAPQERQLLAEKLELSLLGLTQKELERAWAEVADTRYKEYKAGKSSVRSVSDVVADARTKAKR
jgi:hypothetical protein